ncbi:hypothetical protein C1D09_006600 [Mesorhizobium intechi]|uniref:Immunity protein 52 domain-containing protein n=1 Tax=Mesorhizobium intechi TaxID=537601 RepID=A0A8T9AY74_9HYPH|nr:Imm52 family immunity protein [Mesorhizobium intechi]TSE12931.1 hypothetical protein C1D09_006600 [Mesorhizobium intechi]
MSVNIYVYWGSRNDNIDDLVQRTQLHFRVLAKADERLSQWALLGRSLKKAMTSEKIDTSSAELLHGWLLRGQNRTDVAPRQPIPELGYRLSLWNQRSGNVEASTSINCGAYSEYLSNDSQNSASLELTYLQEHGIDSTLLINIFKEMVEIWSPAWGMIWKYVHTGHPAAVPSDPTQIQLAFYQKHDGLGPKNRTIGLESRARSGGSIWINEQVGNLLERQ